MNVTPLRLLPLALLLACPGPEKPGTGGADDDVDNDGYTEAEGDCDDTDATLNPGENEVWYDGRDQDCDGNDMDRDLDGVLVGDDCDDLDPAVLPGATELCDGLDNDCNGLVDDGAPGTATAWVDADLDGYGAAGTETELCGELTEGWADNGDDCDDAHAEAFPGAEEVCDDVDNDCDGEINEDHPADVWYYLDADQDTFGDAENAVLSCATPIGFTDVDGDCDDTDPAVNPNGVETCAEADQDCDGDAYAGAVDAVLYYDDLDGDAFGDPATADALCEAPVGAVTDATDCDDTDAASHPGGTEACDGHDNDCDGTVDDGVTTTFYADVDADGHGDPGAPTEACSLGAGQSTDATDCDDADAATYDGATEVCDLEDNDCDGDVDEGAPLDRTYYLDDDGDGYGDASASVSGCGTPAGYAEVAGDCDDTDDAVNPGAPELCGGSDEDCDGLTDEDDAADAASWYPDGDEDGFGAAATGVTACEQPAGYVTDPSDCDDTDAGDNPAATETCDGDDDDCDGAVDEDDAADATAWYLDADRDGYGDAAASDTACLAPTGYVADATDCDDARATANPGASELCNTVDDDCDGDTDEPEAIDATAYYDDLDADGFGDPASEEISCSVPADTILDGTDCDDAADDVFPGAPETDDGRDEDCDGWVDEDFVVAGDVIVTEVMRQPRFGTSATVTDGQWFEIANVSARTVDLSSWYLSRTSSIGTDGYSIDPGAAPLLAPGDRAVFCKTDDYTTTAEPTASTLECDYVWGDEAEDDAYSGAWHDNTFNLQRDDDTITLALDALTIDEIHWTYDATDGYWPRNATQSMSLDPAFLDATDNDDEANWCSTATSSSYMWWYVSAADVEYGTPGGANYDCP